MKALTFKTVFKEEADVLAENLGGPERRGYFHYPDDPDKFQQSMKDPDANKMYLNNLDRYIGLHRTYMNPKSEWERDRSAIEMSKARAVMDHWQNHPSYREDTSRQEHAARVKMWTDNWEKKDKELGAEPHHGVPRGKDELSFPHPNEFLPPVRKQNNKVAQARDNDLAARQAAAADYLSGRGRINATIVDKDGTGEAGGGKGAKTPGQRYELRGAQKAAVAGEPGKDTRINGGQDFSTLDARGKQLATQMKLGDLAAKFNGGKGSGSVDTQRQRPGIVGYDPAQRRDGSAAARPVAPAGDMGGFKKGDRDFETHLRAQSGRTGDVPERASVDPRSKYTGLGWHKEWLSKATRAQKWEDSQRAMPKSATGDAVNNARRERNAAVKDYRKLVDTRASDEDIQKALGRVTKARKAHDAAKAAGSAPSTFTPPKGADQARRDDVQARKAAVGRMAGPGAVGDADHEDALRSGENTPARYNPELEDKAGKVMSGGGGANPVDAAHPGKIAGARRPLGVTLKQSTMKDAVARVQQAGGRLEVQAPEERKNVSKFRDPSTSKAMNPDDEHKAKWITGGPEARRRR